MATTVSRTEFGGWQYITFTVAPTQSINATGTLTFQLYRPCGTSTFGWLMPEEVLIADKEDGKTLFTWAADLDLKAWLDEYTLRDLWLMGNLGGRP